MFEAWILLASLTTAGSADVSQCAAMADDTRRLACYDALFRAADPPAHQEAYGEQPARTQAAVAAPAAVVAPVPEEDFGLSADQRAERDGVKGPDVIKAVVVEIHKSRVGKPAYIFDNGQRWRQVDATGQPMLKVGRTVVIRKAALGSFMATMPEVGGPPVRIRREK